jgi:O-antigen ligase
VWRYRIRGVIGMAALCTLLCVAPVAIPGVHAYLDRGDVGSFTGRQVAWDFAVRSIKEHPLTGYGYEVEGEILQSRYFSGWDEVWDEGYQTSLHNGYLSRAVSLGIPGLLFWLFLMMRPMASCLIRNQNPWSMKSIVWLSLLPALIMNCTESISDFRSFAGIEMALVWVILERQRLCARMQARARSEIAEGRRNSLVRALQA